VFQLDENEDVRALQKLDEIVVAVVVVVVVAVGVGVGVFFETSGWRDGSSRIVSNVSLVLRVLQVSLINETSFAF
jgi:hypothetical protein